MNEKEQVTAWVTKYAMTGGVEKVVGHMYEEYFAFRPDGRYEVLCGRKDYHLNAESARIDAERRRTAKIKSLTEQLRKLETLDIVIPE